MNLEFDQQAEYTILVKEPLEIHPGWLNTKLFLENSEIHPGWI